MRACLIVPVVLCSLAAPAAAQVVSGRIVTSRGGGPVAAATVRLVAERGDTASALTDAAGRFVVRAHGAGSFRLAAEGAGLRGAIATPLYLVRGDSMDVRLRLAPDTVLLNPLDVVVSAGRQPGWRQAFYGRAEQHAGGWFATRAEIERRAAARTTELLAGVPGLTLPGGESGSGVRGRGGCTPSVYLDGVLLRGGAAAIDLWTTPPELEGIEVYTAAAGAVEYGSAAACGSIVLWTRGQE